MGVSSSGILAFGVDLGERNPLLPDPEVDYEAYEAAQEEDLDLGAYLAIRSGASDPYKELPEEINNGTSEQYSEWKRNNPGFEAQTDAWYELRKKLKDAAPIEIVWYCTYDYPMYIIALKGREFSAYQGSPETIDAESLVVDPAEIEAARTFCEANGLPAFEEPQWLLTSDYG